MIATTTGQRRLVTVGETGMVGGYALRYALDHSAVCRVTVIGRRSVGISHPKLKEVLHKDFGNCSTLAEALSQQDAAVFCLGTYTGPYRTRNSAKQQRITQSSSRAFFAPAARSRCFHS